MNKNKKIAAALFVIVIVAYAGLKMNSAGLAKDKIDTALLGAEKFVKVEYKDASVDLLSQNVHITDIVILPDKSQTPLNIAEVVIYDIDQSSQIPAFLEIEVKGVEILLTNLDKKDTEIWQELGFSDKVELDFAFSYQYQNDSDQLSLEMKKLHFRGENLGELNASLRIGNLPSMADGLAGILFTYPKITLHNAQINYKDGSLVEKTLRIGAKEMNKSIEDVRKEAIADIEKQMALTKNVVIRDALSAVKDFMADPDELVVSIAPDKPLSIQQLMQMNDPKRLAEELKLSVK